MTDYGLQEILRILFLMGYPVAWVVVVYAIYRSLSRITKGRR